MDLPQEYIQELDLPRIVELFELTYTDTITTTTVYLTNTFRKDPIYWNTNQYTSFPILLEGIGFTEDNLSQSPKLTLSNVNADYTALFAAIPNLKNSKLTYIRVFEPYIKPSSASNTNLAICKHHFTISRMVSKTKTNRIYELNTLLGATDKKLPSRQMLREGKLNFRFEGLGINKHV